MGTLAVTEADKGRRRFKRWARIFVVACRWKRPKDQSVQNRTVLIAAYKRRTVFLNPSATFSSSPTALTRPFLRSISISSRSNSSTAGNHASET